MYLGREIDVVVCHRGEEVIRSGGLGLNIVHPGTPCDFRLLVPSIVQLPWLDLVARPPPDLVAETAAASVELSDPKEDKDARGQAGGAEPKAVRRKEEGEDDEDDDADEKVDDANNVPVVTMMSVEIYVGRDRTYQKTCLGRLMFDLAEARKWGKLCFSISS